ncbi:MAG: hypothetical protein ABSC94_12055 [Polyangiaceae bacterium]
MPKALPHRRREADTKPPPIGDELEIESFMAVSSREFLCPMPIPLRDARRSLAPEELATTRGPPQPSTKARVALAGGHPADPQWRAPMARPGALRAALLASLVLFLLTFAREGYAGSAPLCDDRGATVLAPAPLPILNASDEAVARSRESCNAYAGAPLTAIARSGAIPRATRSWVDRALSRTPSLPKAPPAAPAQWMCMASASGRRVSGRIERPPRH